MYTCFVNIILSTYLQYNTHLFLLYIIKYSDMLSTCLSHILPKTMYMIVSKHTISNNNYIILIQVHKPFTLLLFSLGVVH